MSPISVLSPESRLVFRSADPAILPAEVVSRAAAVEGWPRAVALAERELATPALARALREGKATVPADATEHLRRSAMVSDFRMQHLARRLQQVCETFAARGIPCLLLKGAAVGAWADPTFRSRPMTDVDLLVRREDVARAREAVIAAGWPETTDPIVRALLADQHHLPPFLDPQMPGVRLELHLSLLPADHSFAFDESHLWTDARPGRAPFATALVPSPIHLLLHSCVHFAWQHSMQFGAWRTFRSVGLVVASGELDWERFTETARTARAATACYWTLRLAARLCGIAIPASVLERLAPPTPEWLRAAIERHFLALLVPGESPVSPSVLLSRLLWRAALRPRWSGHRTPGRWDAEQRWERAQGVALSNSVRDRLSRHVAGYRDWWAYLSGTLFG